MKWDDWERADGIADDLDWDSVPDADLASADRERIDGQIRGLFQAGDADFVSPASTSDQIVERPHAARPSVPSVRVRNRRRVLVALLVAVVIVVGLAGATLLRQSNAVEAIDTKPMLETIDPDGG